MSPVSSGRSIFLLPRVASVSALLTSAANTGEAFEITLLQTSSITFFAPASCFTRIITLVSAAAVAMRTTLSVAIVALLSMVQGEMSGMELLRRFGDRPPSCAVVGIDRFASISFFDITIIREMPVTLL